MRVQNVASPAEMRHAVVDLLDDTITGLRVASAYTTLKGSQILFDCLSEFLNQKRIDSMPKLLITSVDFGITEPAVLKKWKSLPNASVRIAGADLLKKGSLLPQIAFHPKIYAFEKRSVANLLIGSANLTTRGFSINTEAGWSELGVKKAAVDAMFRTVMSGTTPLTDDLLTRYKALRKRKPPPPQLKLETEDVPSPIVIPRARLSTFLDAVNGGVQPSRYSEFWIQVDKLQGGSENQLELPRGGHQFFGFNFTNYAYQKKMTIGVPVIRAGARTWTDRLLTWHGDNKMERMNLPTQSQGGFSYASSGIMFRRLSGGAFELIVVPWASDFARSWQEASRLKGLLFQVGSTHRLCGLI
jgi:HKD family nuclease